MSISTTHDDVIKLVELMTGSRAELFQAMQHHPHSPYKDQHEHPVTDHIDAIRKNVAEVSAIIEKLQKCHLSDKQRVPLDKYIEERNHYVNEGLIPACTAIVKGDFHMANEILLDKALPMSIVAIHEVESFGHVGVAEKTLVDLSAIFGIAMVAMSCWIGVQAF